MTKWPDAHDAIIRQHLRHARLRPASVRTYRPMLVEFQQFVVDHSPERCVSRPILESGSVTGRAFQLHTLSCSGFGQSIVFSTGLPSAN